MLDKVCVGRLQLVALCCVRSLCKKLPNVPKQILRKADPPSVTSLQCAGRPKDYAGYSITAIAKSIHCIMSALGRRQSLTT